MKTAAAATAVPTMMLPAVMLFLSFSPVVAVEMRAAVVVPIGALPWFPIAAAPIVAVLPACVTPVAVETASSLASMPTLGSGCLP